MTDQKDDKVKIDGQEQDLGDKAVTAHGQVEREVGQALDDEHMQEEGHRRVAEHGSLDDVADTIARDIEHEKNK